MSKQYIVSTNVICTYAVFEQRYSDLGCSKYDLEMFANCRTFTPTYLELLTRSYYNSSPDHTTTPHQVIRPNLSEKGFFYTEIRLDQGYVEPRNSAPGYKAQTSHPRISSYIGCPQPPEPSLACGQTWIQRPSSLRASNIKESLW